MNSIHLTSDQIDDHLIGDLAAAPAAHLASCPQCQSAVAAAASPLSSFRDVSLAWAERRSATMPSPIAAAKPTAGRFSWITASAVATAAVAVAVSIPLAHHTAAPAASSASHAGVTIASTPATPTNSPSTTNEDQTSQVARDNQMLAAIDDALNAPVRPVSLDHHARLRANLSRS